tara:strand:- start:17105 stop:17320 length:216 start_codon:yes stop_codon:yes gene_type:complete
LHSKKEGTNQSIENDPLREKEKEYDVASLFLVKLSRCWYDAEVMFIERDFLPRLKGDLIGFMEAFHVSRLG